MTSPALPVTVLILAAGQGSRMKSGTLKLLHKAAGRRLIDHVRLTGESIQPQDIYFVVAPGMDALAHSILPHKSVIQPQALGTGHAVQSAMAALGNHPYGIVLVMLGDCPMAAADDARALINAFADDRVDAAYLAARLPDPTGCGRLSVAGERVLCIIEESEANPAQKEINLCNGGMVAFRADRLPGYLAQLTNNNKKGEYYLTDIAQLIHRADRWAVYVETSPERILGVNERAGLAAVEAALQHDLRTQAMERGVTLRDPATVTFSMDTVLGRDVTIEPNVVFGEGVTVHDNVTIRAFSYLEDVTIHQNASVGPFARLRGGVVLEEGVHIGNFVEVKKSRLGKGTKAGHLAYIGDSTLGDNVNVGAGTVTCNYDGVNKHETHIGAGVFIGSNSTLVAPVTIAPDAYIAAGSVITDTVPEGALALGRARQVNKDKWRRKNGAKYKG